MKMDILSVLEHKFPSFSKGQRTIAQFILKNYDKAAFMTAARLGEVTGVSESTVVRFAADLGYRGYPGMKKALQEIVRNRLTSVERLRAPWTGTMYSKRCCVPTSITFRPRSTRSIRITSIRRST